MIAELAPIAQQPRDLDAALWAIYAKPPGTLTAADRAVIDAAEAEHAAQQAAAGEA